MQRADVVIVGGGVGGSALGAALAEAGLRVEILERTTHFVDRVRGEWMAPWGVAETRRLGLYETLLDAGGHHLSRHIGYDELVDPADAEAQALPIAVLHPESPGPLCLEHVRMQNALLDRARDCGAGVTRGVSSVELEPGPAPRVRYRNGAGEIEIECRLVVGADGRSSGVRRQLGIELHEDPIDHLIAGLLVDGAHDWPDDLQAMGKVGDINYLVFPQGEGRVRLYADYDIADRGRFSGADAASSMLAAFDMDCVPNSRCLADSTPIGPCRSYPSQDAWTERPFVDGGVLMGDAAGYNDPIIGQGLSIAFRDARMLRDALTGCDDWREEIFEPYADERRERLRRLRFVAAFITQMFARFDARGLERRRRAVERLAEKPEFGLLGVAAYAGPETVGAEYFTAAFASRVFDP